MGVTQWTEEAGATLDLDPTYKAEGNSSGRVTGGVSASYDSIYRTALSMTGFVAIFHAAASGYQTRVATARANHPSYTHFDLVSSTGPAGAAWEPPVWYKFRVTFWYDSTNDTKWGRLEKWIAGAWEQQGADENCGSGAPAAGSIYLGVYSSGNVSKRAYFDAIDVYEVS